MRPLRLQAEQHWSVQVGGWTNQPNVASQLHVAGSDLKGLFIINTTERQLSHSHLSPEPERASPRAPGLGLPLQTSSTTSARSLMS